MLPLDGLLVVAVEQAVSAPHCTRGWWRSTSAATARAARGAASRAYDLLEHPQLVERDRWVQTPSESGDFLSLRPAADSADWDWTVRGVPALGEHTAAVLEELGLLGGTR